MKTRKNKFKDATYRKLKTARWIFIGLLFIPSCYLIFHDYNSSITKYILTFFAIYALIISICIESIDFLYKPFILKGRESRIERLKFILDRHLFFFALCIVASIAFALEGSRNSLLSIFFKFISHLDYIYRHLSDLYFSKNINSLCEGNSSYGASLSDMQGQMINIWLFVMTILISLLVSSVFTFNKKFQKDFDSDSEGDIKSDISEIFFGKLSVNIILICTIMVAIYFIFLHITYKFSLVGFSKDGLLTKIICDDFIADIIENTILSYNVLFIILPIFMVGFFVLKYVVFNIIEYVAMLIVDIITIVFKGLD